MTAYLDIVKKLTTSFQEYTARHIPKGENSHVDVLISLGSGTKTNTPKVIPVVYLQWSKVWNERGERIAEVAKDSLWMTPILEYLQNNTLLANRNEAR